MNPYPTLAQILRLTLVAMVLAQFLVGPIAALYAPQAGIIAAEGAVVWLMALFIRRHHMVPEDLLLLNAIPLSTLAVTGTTALSASLLITDFDLVFNRLLAGLDLGQPLYLQRELLELQLARDLPGLGLIAVTLALTPGLCEELFFRGFIFTGLYFHYGPRAALLGSALLFAAAHLIRPWQFPAFFLFGLFLAALVYWTHSLYPAILAHTVNNLVSVVGINLKAHLGVDVLSIDQHLPLPAVALAAIALFSGVLFLRRQPSVIPLPRPTPRQSPQTGFC